MSLQGATFILSVEGMELNVFSLSTFFLTTRFYDCEMLRCQVYYFVIDVLFTMKLTKLKNFAFSQGNVIMVKNQGKLKKQRAFQNS